MSVDLGPERRLGRAYSVSPPVAPLPELLPLGDPNLSWERFEAFCRDLISRLPGVGTCYHYGKPGNWQRGIDLVCEREDGTRWVFQCRQRKKLTKGQVERAIGATTYRADRYFLVSSCIAGAAVRDVFAEHPNWEMWDARDISQKVREFSVDQAARLVHHHFGPAWRSAFVGLTGPTPFVSAQEFFEPFMDSDRLFNHAWALVGRERQLLQLEEFLQTDSHRVAILTGRGGIGKTKVLHGLSQRARSVSSYEVRFVAEGIPLTPESADSLPASACLMIVDDAHRREDSVHLLSIARRRSHPTKLLLSARPYGVDHLSSLLTQAGFEPREIMRIDEIKELGLDEVGDLARQALGKEFAAFADRLAAVTWDCPLVTVVGGRLLAEKQLPLDLLERDEDFRQTVLGRFGDALIGQVSGRLEPAVCRSLLELIAAIGPYRLNKEPLKEKAAAFLQMKPHRVIEALGLLEEAGVLIRRGYTLRITPDVLADHMLHSACLTSGGDRTGYAEAVFKVFASVCPAELLRNLAELDWRINIGAGREVSVLTDIWAMIEAEFRGATNRGRCWILDVLKEAAYYQPGRTLALVELAMRSPASEDDDNEASQIYRYTHKDVLQRLPRLLEHVGYTLDYLPRCCDLLWELGRDDASTVNEPEHAVRVLQDLAGYHHGRPLVMNEMVLDAVERWLREPDAHDHVHSPLDVIDPMLAKTGHSTRAEGHNVVLTPFLVSEQNTRPLRDRALGIIGVCARTANRRTVLRTIKSLDKALEEPVPLFDMTIPDEERERWVPEQVRVLDEMREIVASTTDSLIHLGIWKAVHWQARRGPTQAIRDGAQGIVDAIPQTDDMRLTRLLMHSWDPFWLPDEEEDFHAAHERHEREFREMQRDVALRFLKTYADPRVGVRVLGDKLRDIQESGQQAEPQAFLHALAEADTTYAAAACEKIIGMPQDIIAPYLAVFLRGARLGDTPRSLELARRAVETKHPTLCRAVANSYWWVGWEEDLRQEDVELLRMLVGNADPSVRRTAIFSLAALGRAQPRLAIELALAVEVGEDKDIARELFQIFHAGLGIAIDALKDDEMEVLLGKLEAVSDIDDHWVMEFIKASVRRVPKSTVHLLISRLNRASGEDHTYRPLPFEPLDLDGVESSPDYEDILREIRDQAATVGPLVREFYLPKLFSSVSKNFSHPVALEVLSEWIGSGETQKIEAAGSLVKGAPSDFVFDNAEFVRSLLEKSHEAGEECYRHVCGHLYGAAISGISWGTPGKPTPRDIALRDRASEIARGLPGGSPVRKFYESLVEHAEVSIRDQLARDEELFE